MGAEASRPLLDSSRPSISFRNRLLKKIPYRIPPNHRLEIIDLTNNRITCLPKHLKNLKSLDISLNKLTTIDGPIESSLLTYENLTELKIRGNYLTDIPKSLEALKSLKILHLGNNRLLKFDLCLPNLISLDLSSNQIQNFDQIRSNKIVSLNLSFNFLNEFHTQNFPNIRQLILTGNNLKEFSLANDKNIIFSSLTMLNISHNIIKEFEDVSNCAPKLEKLNISYNLLNKFPSKLPKTLNGVDLSYNKLVLIDEDLSKMRALNLLLLNHNFLTKMPKLPLGLDSIRLDKNRISHHVCLQSSLMQSLPLRANKLTEIPNFSNSTITVLNISRNKIVNINTKNFSKCIVRCDLSFNQIEKIPEIFFIDLPHIRFLNIDGNKIQQLPDNILNTNLVSLNISENPISDLPELPSTITHIYGTKCQFVKFPKSVTKLQNLDHLNFAFNQIDIIPSNVNSESFIMAGNNVKFIPTNLLTTVVYLDLSFNKLENIEINFSLPTIVVLNLIGNELKKFQIRSEIPNLSTLRLSKNPGLKIPNFNNNLQFMPKLCYLDLCLTSVNVVIPIPGFIDICELVTPNINFFNEMNNHKYKYFDIDCDISSQMNESNSLSQDSNKINSLTPSNHQHSQQANHNQEHSTKHNSTKHSFTKTYLNRTVSDKANPSKPYSNQVSSGKINAFEKNSIIDESSFESNSISAISSISLNQNFVGYSEMQGLRPTMEDNLIIRKKDGFKIYAVLDGHGGRQASSLASFHIPKLLNFFTVEDIMKAISETNFLLKNSKVEDGTTLCLVALSDDQTQLICANVGDTRALMIRRNGEVLPLSTDHKPDSRIEMVKVRQNGSYVHDGRVSGVLAVSRALGDFTVEGISADPSFSIRKVDPQTDEKIVIACDGVFDVMSNKEVGKLVMGEKDPFRAASIIRNVAYSRQSQDNISVIVINILAGRD
ncbi:hypothetical protein TRFO_10643 [Tritrichomonas foetus]|uniref:PPM-type phosphatase domain-containing protein n=1 Tax=Tritrichomonas foetus TaxID=1144522 RepID=A0A1J4J8Z4_9EUKA|nr:hypothetical protein TRFO_10643 [Tritrichomonas foetus]|eukprot:OHS95161.1 hypothetical protein TRFO_10643 [Tritrichomonas foetus]